MGLREKLMDKWKQIDKEEMPVRISSLPLYLIQRAVDYRESGVLVGVLPEECAVIETHVEESSIMEWDKDNEF